LPFKVADVDVTEVALVVVTVRGNAGGASAVVNVLTSPVAADPSLGRYPSSLK